MITKSGLIKRKNNHEATVIPSSNNTSEHHTKCELYNDNMQNWKGYPIQKAQLIICTDPGDVVIDPCFGSGSTARAALETGRDFYGFEINKEYYRRAHEEMIVLPDDTHLKLAI